MATGEQSGPIEIRREWLPYLRVAEISYLGQAVLALIAGILYVVSYSVISGSLLLETMTAIMTVGVSFGWFKLGREIPISLFTLVGMLGFASSVISLGSAFSAYYPLPYPLSESLGLVISFVIFFVYVAYFIYQAYAFFKAAAIFQVKLFKFAGFMFIVGFLISNPLLIVIGAVYAIHGLASQPLYVLIGLGSFWGGATSVVAGLGFRQPKSGHGMLNSQAGGGTLTGVRHLGRGS